MIGIIVLVQLPLFLVALSVQVRVMASVKKLVARPFACGDINWQSVKCILADMDGTLLTSKLSVPNRTIQAISTLKKVGIPFFPATGRTRIGMVNAGGKALVQALGEDDPSKIAGVFNQGLVVFGKGGSLVYENHLSVNALEWSESYCLKNGLSVIGYHRDEIVTNRITPLTDSSDRGKEPRPVLAPEGLVGFHSSGKGLNKLIILAEESEIVRRRPEIEHQLQNTANVTQAVPGMLEILPFGASKGEGVKKLLEHYAIQPQECVAFGDGENDVEMLKLVGFGIAMRNGRDILHKNAFRSTLSNDEEGVAHVIESIVRRKAESLLSFGSDEKTRVSSSQMLNIHEYV